MEPDYEALAARYEAAAIGRAEETINSQLYGQPLDIALARILTLFHIAESIRKLKERQA